MSWRTIQNVNFQVEGPLSIADPLQAIQEQAAGGRYTYLLAHADDGVIWGFWDGGRLQLSSAAFPAVSPPLREQTLWEARLFGPQVEWFAWRGPQGWLARAVRDGQGAAGIAYDENQVLWGELAEAAAPPFSLLREGDQGIRHAPPVVFGGAHQLRLQVRHYLAEDASGALFVQLSRLVDLK